MDEDTLNNWEEQATDICRLDNARETATKHRGLCNLQAAIHNELGVVLDGCVAVVDEDKDARRRFKDFQRDGNSTVVERVIKLIIKHRAEVEVWEQEDEAVVAARCASLKKYDATKKLDWQEITERMVAAGYGKIIGTAPAHSEPDRIYYYMGAYRIYWRLKDTAEYRILRALQALNVGNDDLGTHYKAVCLYLFLNKERAKVETLAETLGVNLQEPQHDDGTTPHRQQETTPEDKLERFMEHIPAQHKKKAERLLQRVVKAGYCTANYEWIASKWKSRKSRLALVCFVYCASDYLGMSTKEYNDRAATNWRPFEMLFDYDGKKPDKNGEYHQLADVKKQQCKYDEQKRFYQCPEMKEIKERLKI